MQEKYVSYSKKYLFMSMSYVLTKNCIYKHKHIAKNWWYAM